MFGDKFNLGALLKNAKKIQEMMTEAQTELAKVEVTGEAGAGAVKVVMTAQYVVKSLTLDDEILKEEKSVVEQLILAAFNNATEKAQKITQDKMADAGKLFSGE